MKKYNLGAKVPMFAPPYYLIDISSNNNARMTMFNFTTFYLANCLLIAPTITCTKAMHAFSLLKGRSAEGKEANPFVPGIQFAIKADPKLVQGKEVKDHEVHLNIGKEQLQAIIEKNSRSYKVLEGFNQIDYEMNPLGKIGRVAAGSNPTLTAGALGVSAYEYILDEELYRDSNNSSLFASQIIEQVLTSHRRSVEHHLEVDAIKAAGKHHDNPDMKFNIVAMSFTKGLKLLFPKGSVTPGYIAALCNTHSDIRCEILYSLGISFIDYVNRLEGLHKGLSLASDSSKSWRLSTLETFLHSTMTFFFAAFGIQSSALPNDDNYSRRKDADDGKPGYIKFRSILWKDRSAILLNVLKYANRDVLSPLEMNSFHTLLTNSPKISIYVENIRSLHFLYMFFLVDFKEKYQSSDTTKSLLIATPVTHTIRTVQEGTLEKMA